MKQVATVERLLNDGLAEISVARQSACAHDCRDCAGCGQSAQAIHAYVQNPIGARAGQKVVVESSSRQIFGIIFLIYLLPIVLFFVGYFAVPSTAGENTRIAVSILAFLGSIIPAVLYDRKLRKNGGMVFTIVRAF